MQNKSHKTPVGAQVKTEGGGGSEHYHPGQSHVRHDGKEDDPAGGDEVTKSAVLQGGATFSHRIING